MWLSRWEKFWKELLLVTEVLTTWAEVIFRVNFPHSGCRKISLPITVKCIQLQPPNKVFDIFLTSFWLLWWVLLLPVALNCQSDALKNGRRGINRCMIHLQTSEFERVSNNVSHERLCQVQLVINKFYVNKNLVKLNFSHRKCFLGL